MDDIYNSIRICTITETWSKEKAEVTRAELNIDAYVLRILKERRDKGIGLLQHWLTVDYATWTLLLSKFAWMFHVIYRPPFSEAHSVIASVFFKEFSDFLQSACSDSSNCIITCINLKMRKNPYVRTLDGRKVVNSMNSVLMDKT